MEPHHLRKPQRPKRERQKFFSKSYFTEESAATAAVAGTGKGTAAGKAPRGDIARRRGRKDAPRAAVRRVENSQIARSTLKEREREREREVQHPPKRVKEKRVLFLFLFSLF